MIRPSAIKHPSSFRDPSGSIFIGPDGQIFRQINRSYQANYQTLTQSGLYQKLVDQQLLIPHSETTQTPFTKDGWIIIQPTQIPFISYPYEWSFSQLKDAARTTLKIALTALNYNQILKDASAYNIQFYQGRPIFIDTLSFEPWAANNPWKPYQQFCQHFLAPLVLMAKTDVRLNLLLSQYIDGIPLDLASKLLPLTTWANPGLLAHIHLHAQAATHWSARQEKLGSSTIQYSRQRLLALLSNLLDCINSLNWHPPQTTWSKYPQTHNYSKATFAAKEATIRAFIKIVNPSTVWDIGANSGHFSHIAADAGIHTISSDYDPVVVEQNYQTVRKTNQKNLLPLIINLTNPSPAIGWGNVERTSFIKRGPADLVLALALIHHLALGHNVPLPNIARLLSKISRHLVVEFVPKSDSNAAKLLQFKGDIFPNYTEQNFVNAFNQFFIILKKEPLPDSPRTLYLMQRKNV